MSRSSGHGTEKGRVQTIPVSSSNEISAFFDRHASHNLLELHGGKRLLQRQLALFRKFARPRRNDRVLDLGCGAGDPLLALRAEIAEGIGIDLSPKMIETARARVQRGCPGAHLTFRVGDAQSATGVPSQSIELVICIGALEHMLDKRATLRNAYRALRGGGRFFLLSPDPAFIWYTAIAPRFGFRTKHLSTDRFCSGSEVVNLLREAGFSHLETFCWSFVPTGDLPTLLGVLLGAVAVVGGLLGIDSLRGGLGVCARKDGGNGH